MGFRFLRVARSVGALALLGAALLSGCGSTPPLQIRLDQTSYVVHGYYLDSGKMVDLFIEEVRHAGDGAGSVVFELAVLNRRAAPVVVDFGKARVDMNGRSYAPQQPRAVVVRPSTLERATLSFKTGVGVYGFTQGALRFEGVTLESGDAMPPFIVGFHKASLPELEAEFGELGLEMYIE